MAHFYKALVYPFDPLVQPAFPHMGGVSSILRRLRALDASSPEFPVHLTVLLDDEQFKDSIRDLADDDAQWLADSLNTVLGPFGADSPLHWKFSHALRLVCGIRRILPIQVSLSNDSLSANGRSFTLGGYCDAWKGTLGGREVSVKKLRVHHLDDPQIIRTRFYREVASWNRIAHPNIVPLEGVTLEPLQIVSDFMTGENLMEHIEKHPKADIISLLLGAATGLQHLHSLNIVHGDLRAVNVFVDTDGKSRLSDFGISSIMRGPESTIPGGQTLRWAAPELFEVGIVSTKESDIYAFGMLAWEVFAGAAPFANSIPTSVAVQVLSGKRPERPMHASLTDGLWDMIKHCWIQEPLERLQVSEVVADLRCALIARQGHSDIPGITMEGDAALSSSVLRHVSRRIGDVSSSTHRRSLPRSSDIRKSVSWPVSRHIIIDGSEASLLDAKFGEFDEAVEITPRGLCGLFRRIHFWKPNRATLSDWNYDDTKVYS